ncbi:endonuclease domain-containing protein [Corynebacterium bovis]|uniref:endonuclease domain-containing protein n=1 Tax=Corynebacterium bovis TaxID=36808 RepID=UPI000F652CA1|nr:hypothetical protein [Corynebacterium bovis]
MHRRATRRSAVYRPQRTRSRARPRPSRTPEVWPERPATGWDLDLTGPQTRDELRAAGVSRRQLEADYIACAPGRFIPASSIPNRPGPPTTSADPLNLADPANPLNLADPANPLNPATPPNPAAAIPLEVRTRAYWLRHPTWIACSWSAARLWGLRWFCDSMPPCFLTPTTRARPADLTRPLLLSTDRGSPALIDGWSVDVDPAVPSLRVIAPRIACAQLIHSASSGSHAWWTPPVPGLTPREVRVAQVGDAVCRWWGLTASGFSTLCSDIMAARDRRAVEALCDWGADSPPETVVRLACRGLAAGMVTQYELVVDGELVSVADLAWPSQRVLVFYDGAHHGGTDQWLADARRSSDLSASGWVVLRLTRRDLRNPVGIRRMVARALGVRE